MSNLNYINYYAILCYTTFYVQHNFRCRISIKSQLYQTERFLSNRCYLIIESNHSIFNKFNRVSYWFRATIYYRIIDLLWRWLDYVSLGKLQIGIHLQYFQNIDKIWNIDCQNKMDCMRHSEISPTWLLLLIMNLLLVRGPRPILTYHYLYCAGEPRMGSLAKWYRLQIGIKAKRSMRHKGQVITTLMYCSCVQNIKFLLLPNTSAK